MFGCAEGDVGEPAAPQEGPEAFDGVEAGRVGRQMANGQPIPRFAELPQPSGYVDIEIVSDEHDRAAELLVGSGQQVSLVLPGEALA
jgi:hypothetical protein